MFDHLMGLALKGLLLKAKYGDESLLALPRRQKWQNNKRYSLKHLWTAVPEYRIHILYWYAVKNIIKLNYLNTSDHRNMISM